MSREQFRAGNGRTHEPIEDAGGRMAAAKDDAHPGGDEVEGHMSVAGSLPDAPREGIASPAEAEGGCRGQQ